MTKTKTQTFTEKFSLLKNSIQHKFHKENQESKTSEEKMTRDMGDTHTPVSHNDMVQHLDLAGLTREQAKAEIERLVNERLEKISALELAERKVDPAEREKQRTLAAERINERRNQKKEKSLSNKETHFTEQGVSSECKPSSVFDVIKPEPFPFEEEQIADLLTQVSKMETIKDAKGTSKDVSKVHTEFSNEVGLFKEEMKPSGEGEISEASVSESLEPVKMDLMGKEAGGNVSYAIDAAIDKVFLYWAKIKKQCKIGFQATEKFMAGKVLPKVKIASARIENKFHLKDKQKAVAFVFSEKEKVTSEKMAMFISFLDNQVEAILIKATFLIIRIANGFDLVAEYVEHNRKKLLMEFGAGAAVITMIMLFIGSMTSYEYIYNGKVLGIVKNQEDVYKTIDIIGDKLSYEYNAEITIDKEKDISFHKVYAWNSELDSKEDILNRLTYMRDMKANGHGIYVAGKLVTILESEKNAKEVLTLIQDRYLKKDNSVKYEKVGFKETVQIKNVETKLGNIKRKEEALDFMLTGATEKKIHVVQSGETFSEIAKLYGLKQSELLNSNPGVIPEKLQIEQEICLTQIVPVVTVQTKEVATYREVIPYEIAYENTNSLFKNEQTVKSKGQNGEKEVVAEIIRNNGIEASRTELSSKILSQPASQVVLVGTKEPPPLIGTGTLIYPIRGTLTSRYGSRWGRMHSGIDLAASTGTKIKAADGGKVIYAGYNGSLGYCVKINHGNNRITVYGHCSKLFVKTGERVYQGQHIANVGNTGRSTGPHLHFEVHVNGKTKNPLNYL